MQDILQSFGQLKQCIRWVRRKQNETKKVNATLKPRSDKHNLLRKMQ